MATHVSRQRIWVCIAIGLAACGDDSGGSDSAAPEPGEAITFKDISETAITVTWGRATDLKTSSSKLEYKLLRAQSQDDLDAISKLDDSADGVTVVQDFKANTTSKIVTDLEPATSYVFAVVVRDEAGNQALYQPTSAGTLDSSAPQVGSDITFSDLTGTSVTVQWGAASDDSTDPGALQYKLVRAASTAAIDTLGEIALLESDDIVQDFADAITSKDVKGLTSGRVYAFAVVVKDSSGNAALYSPALVATPDQIGPVAGDPINFATTTSTSFTVRWGKATDNASTAASLKYKLVRAVAANDVDTIDEVEAVGAPALLMDYTADTDHADLTGLASSTSYAFAVLVEDEAGNKTLYAPATVATLDISAPTTGTALSFSDVLSDGLTLHWGAATDDVSLAASLEYKVVRAVNVADIDTVADVETISTGDRLVKDYTAAITSTAITGLSSSTEYAFSVVVRDAAGNKAIYTPAAHSTLDATAPAVGSAVTFSAVTPTSLTVSWGPATDDVTPAASLEYKLVRAGDSADLDSVAAADAISGADRVQDFTPNFTSLAVTSLTSSTSYAFAVVVRDGAGNKSLYAAATIATLDVSAPVPGTALSFANVTATSLTVQWGAGTDDVSAAANLEYKVVTGSNTSGIDSIAEVDAITSGAQLVLDYTAATLSAPLTGLTSSTKYAFSVVVRDSAGNEALYSPALQATLDVTAPTTGTAISFPSVSATSMTLHWGRGTDGVTDQEDLQYKVVGALDSDDIDSLAEIDAITSGPFLLQDYQADLVSLPVSGLTSSTSYSFSVVVRDLSGNEALYATATRSTLDITAPVPGTAISFGNVVSTSVTVTWGAATDDVSGPGGLSYKVVRGSTTAELDSIGEADAITSGAGLVMDYASNTTTSAATGLAGQMTYAFAVLVRDQEGNTALYAPATVTTPDGTAPIVGTGIRFSSVSSSGYTITWGVASDDITAPGILEYKLVRGTTPAAIDSIVEADAISGAGLIADWTTNSLTNNITGLSAGNYAAYAVLVRDVAHNMSLYTPNSRVAGPIFFATTVLPVDFGGPSGGDTKCGNLRDMHASTNGTAKAVLALGATRRACLTANCTSASENVDWPLLASTTYYNIDGGVIGTTNTAGIFSFPLTSPTVPGTGYTYGGFLSDWTSAPSAACAGYTDINASGSVNLGFTGVTGPNSLFIGNTGCTTTNGIVPIRLLCAE